MPQTGFSHVALTVTDVPRSAGWYKRLLEADTAFEGEDEHGPIHVMVSGSLMLGLRSHASTSKDDRFDPTRVGLDHLGFGVESQAELEKWRARLDEIGATHSGIQESPFGLHLNAKDPDGMAIEFFMLAVQG